jgi:signal transduction histidine kinase
MPAGQSQLLRDGRWLEEINQRLELPEYKTKRAYVELECLDDRVRLTVKDEGLGFNWRT